MSKIFIILASLFLASCMGPFATGLNDDPFEAESPDDKKLNDLRGTWFCVRTDVVTPDRRAELAFEEELKNYKENMELNVFRFTKGKFLMSMRDENHSLISRTWNFVPVNRIKFSETPGGWSFIINYLDKDSMNIDVVPSLMAGADEPRINCNMVKVDLKEIAGVDIFHPSVNTWRKRPAAPQSEDDIKGVLRSLLNYNSVYIRSLYYASATYVNTKVFNLPFRYYNGGIGLKDVLDDDDPFVGLFHTKEDAYTALRILRNTFSKAEYEKKTHYVLEYAAFMKGLADVL